MPLFMLACFDKPNSLELRKATRPTHTLYMKDHHPNFKVAGPMLNEKGEMVGSLIIVDVPDLAAAKALNAGDPYTKAGLWDRVEIRGFEVAVGKL